MNTDGYETLKVRVDDGIAFATIDHPPINLFDAALIVEMDRFGREVRPTPTCGSSSSTARTPSSSSRTPTSA
jgi:hypothetical protein